MNTKSKPFATSPIDALLTGLAFSLLFAGIGWLLITNPTAVVSEENIRIAWSLWAIFMSLSLMLLVSGLRRR